jgi:hypothetical protein
MAILNHTYTNAKLLTVQRAHAKKGEQTTDHIIYECKLVEQERERLKAAVLRTENWPISKEILMHKYSKTFKKFTDKITFDRV